jgi:hypothetical protein
MIPHIADAMTVSLIHKLLMKAFCYLFLFSPLTGLIYIFLPA